LAFSFQPHNVNAQCYVGCESASTDLPGVPIRPFCNANGFNVSATIGHDDGCSTTGGDIYVIIEAQVKAAPIESRFSGLVTNNPLYFSNIVYAPNANSPTLTQIHTLGNGSRTAILFRFRRTFPATVSSENFTFPFVFAANFFFGDIPWNVWVAAHEPDANGLPILPTVPPLPGEPFGKFAGTINFEAPYFPIIGSNNISTFDNLLRNSWADSDRDGQAHSIMLLPGQELSPVLTIDVPQFVHGFSDVGDRGKLLLCAGGQVKIPDGSEYILTVADMFTCTQASKGILVENGGRVFLSGATVSDAEVGVTAKKGSDVEVFSTTFNNNYKGMRLDNTGIASIADLKISFGFGFGTVFSNTAGLKPPYQGMAAPNTTRGYGLEIISHPQVFLPNASFRGLNNGVRLFRSSFTTTANFLGIRADAGSSVAHQGWAIWGLGLGVETFTYQIGNISGLTALDRSDKGVYIQNMNVAMDRVGIAADAGISLVNCKLKSVSITNVPTLAKALRCRSYGIKTSNCLPLNAGSIIRGNFIDMSNPGNINPIGTGILLGEGSKVTTPNSIGWIVQNNFIDLDRTRWGIRGLGVYNSGFYNNDIEIKNNSLSNVTGVDILNTSSFTANCNDVHTMATEFNAIGYLLRNVNQSDYSCNTTNSLSTGIEFSMGCEGTTLKGSELSNTPLGLLLRNDVALGTQGLDGVNLVQDHGNQWTASAATHQALQFPLVQMSRFGVDPAENAAFNPANNWGTDWFVPEPTPSSPSYSCISAICLPSILAYVKDRNVETAVANGTIYNVGLPGVVPKILENHLYAELQKNPAWAVGNSLFSQFLQSKANTTTSAFWYIQQGIDALNNRTDSEQDAVGAAETTIASIRQSLYLMDSTYASGTAINNVLYRQRLASLSVATATLQTLLDNIRSARLTQAAQLLTQNAAIGTTQTWEQSEQQVNELEIRLFIQDSVTTPQLTLLDALGTLCPQTNGEGVLRAQVLYNRFVEKEFSPVCTGARGEAGARTEESFVPVALRLFPNPSTGLVTIPSLDNAMRTIEVYDVAGRLTHQITTSDIEFDLSDLNSGVYLLRIKEEATGKTDSAKLIISK
jgi:hypothetical protein